MFQQVVAQNECNWKCNFLRINTVFNFKHFPLYLYLCVRVHLYLSECQEIKRLIKAATTVCGTICWLSAPTLAAEVITMEKDPQH